NLDANPCTVHVEAADSKGKRADDLILNNATAAEIKTFLTSRKPTAPAFNLPVNSHAAQMLRADLEAAGIEYTDAAGRDCDFHSLRHTFITNLFLAGVPATVVQRLARHKDLKTTLKYSHVSYDSEVAAIQKLRDLTVTCPEHNQTDTPVDNGGIKKVG
ncbi:MAG: tyrosine-type recombinase/integrase, partial [Planctomycetota bacterium]